MVNFHTAAQQIAYLEHQVAEQQRAADALPTRGALRPAYLDAERSLQVTKQRLAHARREYELLLAAPPDLRRMGFAILSEGKVDTAAEVLLRRHGA